VALACVYIRCMRGENIKGETGPQGADFHDSLRMYLRKKFDPGRPRSMGLSKGVPISNGFLR